jgi:hypothetical protein
VQVWKDLHLQAHGKDGKTQKELLALIALMPASAQGDLKAAIKKTA